MMKSIKVSELTGQELNWAVQHAEGLTGILAPVNYCGRWEFGGPIIERELIETARGGAYAEHFWKATRNSNTAYGPTPLIAAMRCYVASKLGDTIELPEGLL
jgi:hypothetical protein